LIDGREELPQEVADAPEELRSFIADEFGQLLGNPSFDSGIQGSLLPGPETQERADLIVKPRIEETIAAKPAGHGHSNAPRLR
jgi:hypothetical protein